MKLDWIPPNVDNELVTDYMSQLESTNVPVSGSEAAMKRKQQLQIQVQKSTPSSSSIMNIFKTLFQMPLPI